MKNELKIALGTLLLSSSVFAIYGIKSISKETIQSIGNDGTQISNNQDENTNEIKLQSLTILGNKCRGCGRCVRIDPEHFEMNGRNAKVISSSNLNSAALQQAISICEGGAIVLN